MTPPSRPGERGSAEDLSAPDGDAAPRVFAWQLLARLLRAAPDGALLAFLRDMDAGAGEFAAQWRGLVDAVSDVVSAASVEEEYTDLFIGLGRGQVVPYGSWYATGFLMDRPLAALRQDLARLGFERDEDTAEPEDHIAALAEVMALLIEEEPRPGEGDQRAFFEQHVEPWASAFFRDLAAAPAARFYRAVGSFGEALVGFEARYLKMLN